MNINNTVKLSLLKPISAHKKICLGKSKLEDLMCFKKFNSFFNFMGEKNRIFRRILDQKIFLD